MQTKVLLVDDAVDFVSYMKKRLTARGLTVLTASSGPEALEIVKEQPLDVVVLDVIMPVMDGIETLKAIKKIKPNLKVVLLTGHGTVESASEGKKLGAVDFILKPCDIDTMLAAIN